MSDDKKNNDIFLQSIGKVKPLKKNNKSFNELNPTHIKETIKPKKVEKTRNIKQTIAIKVENNKKNYKIESASIEKKFKKGKILINKKVDFHGLSIEEAKRKFFWTIEECFYSNKRCILFVTGKGLKKLDRDTTSTRLFYGKIRENFQQWIYEKNVSEKILNVTPAGFSYGGDGAFFVYLRKNKG